MNTSADLLNELRIDRSAPPPAPNRRGLWIGLAIAGAVALLGGGAYVMFRGTPGPEVHVAEVQAIGAGGNAAVLDATGYVVARRMATVSSKITGKVREVRIEEGQHVNAGDIMATLDPVDADAQRSLAVSQLEASRSQIAGVQAQLRDAEANAARLSSLASQQLVSKAQYSLAVAQRDALRAQLVTARRTAQVSSANLRIAGNGLDNTVVRAPFSGVIIAKAAQPGEIVSPLSAGGGFTRTGIGTIVDMESLEVEVDVGESYIGRVKPGMPVVSMLNAYPDWKIPGEVIAIIPTADRGKATVKVRVGLSQHDARVVPDMGVRVSFLERETPKASKAPSALVPSTAIVDRNGKDVAFVVEGDAAKATVKLRAVQLGRTLGDDREVLSGLQGGERVVIEPPADLADGASVRIAKDADAAATE
ncbi:efflux RND transporter periplasmic adaptor subunit [Cognatilysobacter lacus]|uniref:Efflux RND transporter periplasmic adaptor subunit n=1 Tax=Cognatilysobacter lacus TaxID=1643323 RepID=A0A5D8YYC3_9GAMM|nr:efflux RND transporter periplasmic adaptor subunit [Lysobacter lacus]TZF87481.1 efflux RND transporter periplasmic adaptor subunit [Lysobacter lacus]